MSNYCIYQKFLVLLQRILKPLKHMSVKTISGYQGYGYRIQLIQREELLNEFCVLINRRVIISTDDQTLAKSVFLNQVASVVRQTGINFGL